MPGESSDSPRPSRRARLALGFAWIGLIPAGCRPATGPGAEVSLVTWTARPPANDSPLGDPRDDRSALAAARAQIIGAPTWAEGYARLIRDASGKPDPRAVRVDERSPNEPNDVADQLLADLLGATIIDTQDELTQVGSAMSNHPVGAERVAAWTQAPPWPPEFVSQLIRRRMRRGDDPGPWVEALATQIAPETSSRDWLLASWTRPRRPLDADLLGEIAGADGGRLAREPRFRAWLRGEWRAWARQKYRLVERQAREVPR